MKLIIGFIGFILLLFVFPLELFRITLNGLFNAELENRFGDWVWNTFFREYE